MAGTSTALGQEFYPITGIVPTGTNVPNRRDIEAWYAERTTNAETAIQVTLFILAMNEWYTQPVEEQLSYFRIAGIHGQPYGIPWDQTQNKNGVFCVHGQPTFPTFHRVYLTLYEQVLHDIMGQIVDKAFPTDNEANKAKNGANNTAWHAAADNWRLPFWDWTTNTLPLIATDSTISVLDTATGEWGAPINNPMYSFRIDSKYNTMGDPKLGKYAIKPAVIRDQNGKVVTTWPFDKCQGTDRHVVAQTGAESEWVDGTSQNDSVQTALTEAADLQDGGFSSLTDCLSRLMSENYFNSWEQFATTKYYDSGASGTTWLSLEQIHNAVHDMTGGSDRNTGLGHMCWVPSAAFDPIFWHHHCFIDLICAWWQSENPSKFFDQPLNTPDQSGNVDPDPPVTASLPPFHSKKVGPDADWTSEKARYISDFHYGYKYAPWPTGDASTAPQADRSSFARLVNKKLNLTRTTVLDAAEKHPKIQLNTKKDNDVILNVRYNRYGLNGGDPYKIHFFIGDVNNTIPLGQNESHVGAIYNFSASVEESGCANCKQQIEANTLHTGQLPITTPIIADAIDTNIPEFNIFQRHEIEAYLKEKLSWRITAAGVEIPVSAFPDLHVVVYIGTAHHAESDSVLSSYGGYEPIYGATETKVGGATPPST